MDLQQQITAIHHYFSFFFVNRKTNYTSPKTPDFYFHYQNFSVFQVSID